MKIAYYALHYGKEYLAWSIRSVQDAVDEIHILYTPTPSFGHATKASCPDSEQELRQEAERFLKFGKPFFWHTGTWHGEGHHRTSIEQIAKDRGAELVLVVDADEVWPPGSAEQALQATWDANAARETLVHMVHFWRSFWWFCQDLCRPCRVVDRRHGEGFWYLLPQAKPVYHFGYAQSVATTAYKWEIHGHKNELREGWLANKFLAWSPTHPSSDVHPTCGDGFWTPAATSPELIADLKTVVGDHPYWDHDLIP
jgi:hypothetical protein